MNAFSNFAPTVVRLYRRNPEAFWAAAMAPFLAHRMSPLSQLRHLRVGVGLFSAFRGLDSEARDVLRAFGARVDLDIGAWPSNRPQYFKDAYPVFAFLAVWLAEEGLGDLIRRFDEILRAGVYAVAGYGILDANVDSNAPAPVEMLVAQALIAEYETLALQVFGVTEVNLAIMSRMRSLFLEAEIREKSARWKSSPYRREDPKQLGAKGANSVTPFMLSLERLGRAHQVDAYWEVFLLFGAAIQMIDDWQDLEGDLEIGHYSYMTIGREDVVRGHSAAEAAALLRGDKELVQDSYAAAKELIAQARAILAGLGDRFLVRLVDITELRLDTYFQRELKPER
jgi:hypothetical protein